ncbi:MAG: phenazine biosynthesis protein [Microbacterium sp.]|uniref:pyridoxine/pyridoxamine 5'-phosphate oxidase n=1 Tax=Microbacterium sp. TaxID=51671 RepID=UPI000DB238F2|nr:pyridoxamine 5'-phosphate oxidase family protein [Microbacterium sp.]PZU39911.1 MAG: phenazine biosynthesis protein [Microbacterium sp.]
MSRPSRDPQLVFPQTPTDVAPLNQAAAPENPLDLLGGWLDAVVARGAVEPYYVTLATSSRDGIPSSRTVQLLDVEADALLFTTNAGSRKGVEMRETGRAAVSMYWRETAQSINVTGAVVWADDAESDERFARESRPVQASRSVSFHGLTLEDESAQLTAFSELVESDSVIPRPEYWRWLRVIPDAVTFWEGHTQALNRRLHYAREAGTWTRRAVQA